MEYSAFLIVIIVLALVFDFINGFSSSCLGSILQLRSIFHFQRPQRCKHNCKSGSR